MLSQIPRTGFLRTVSTRWLLIQQYTYAWVPFDISAMCESDIKLCRTFMHEVCQGIRSFVISEGEEISEGLIS